MRHSKILLCGILAAATLGCQSEPEPKRAVVDVPKVPGVQVKVATPQWPAATSLDTKAQARMTTAAQAKVATSPVPALMPRFRTESAIVTTGEHFYAASIPGDGITVSVHASRVAYEYAGLPKAVPSQADRSLRGVIGRVGRNEGIWSVAWVEGGVAYELEVECGTSVDTRCADESFTLHLARDLAFVGGKGLKGGAK